MTDPASHHLAANGAQNDRTPPPQSEDDLLARAVVRLSGHILGVVFGIVMALALFVATNWLVLKGGPVVGPHLGLLGQFFIGYSVSFAGSLVGALYAFVTGYLAGLFIAWAYNSIAFLRR
ncbi:MAG TPA: hypothetical protein VMS12_06335 [Thermoanaerobaculia bacterium]|nr:hypothetical protein [Thermoanaerobaculia bacterium]